MPTRNGIGYIALIQINICVVKNKNVSLQKL